ncbi:ribose 5-phosphate isomerase B [Candidatus Heimdallarchaeota archaeon B3_Heim]|nr:MAG: ribose 5-phosphate isomerase B [Candidatus Heimdallarchaeota archaeon B3_Heim]
MKKIIIGSDHGGFHLKNDLMKFLKGLGYEVSDYGCYSTDPVDYPDIALLVAQTVAVSLESFGILIDGTGVASAIVANKIKGIRATPCTDEFTANSAREHNNSNILTLGARVIGPGIAQNIVKIWLTTHFGGGRHETRVNKITEIELKYLKSA